MIKELFNTTFNTKLVNVWLLLLRVFTAAFMLSHGYPKLVKLMEGGEIKFADPIGIGPEASLILAVFSEFFCSILIGLGLFTRLATFPLIITMSVAAFISHAADPFGRKELALMYLLLYISMLVFGGGKYSVDKIISNRMS